jgi:hypothetical protein
LKLSLAGVNERCEQSLRPGVISATGFGIRHYSLSLEKSDFSKDDLPNPEACAEGTSLLLETHSGLEACTRLYLEQCSFPT